MKAAASLSIVAPRGVPMVSAGDDLPGIVLASLESGQHSLEDGDVVVLAQKIVSKAEGRAFLLSSVTPSARAVKLGAQCHKDPRLVELVLAEASEVMRVKPGVLIVRHRLGLVLANAGIDKSNLEDAEMAGDTNVLLLPLDPDATCRKIRDELRRRAGVDVAVLIIDSLGRAWRLGTTGTAIGVAGLVALADMRGKPDLFGRALETSEIGLGDEVAAAASLLMGQTDEGRPIAVLRGLGHQVGDGRAGDLVRSPQMDMFP